MMRMEDLGELAYGGLVVGANELDKQRIARGELAEADVFKKFSTWAYLIPGAGTTIMSAFGMMRQIERWNEHISHGFIYGFPAFIIDTVNAMRGGATASSRQAAVKQAQQILNSHKQLGSGRQASRSYQEEFETVAPYAF